jgi:cell wall-associated NlpC family hydrolase
VIQAADMMTFARSLVGTPYRDKGRNELGLDCLGFVWFVLNKFQLWPADQEDPRDYGRKVDERMMRAVIKRCTRVQAPIDGCIILIRWKTDPHPTHIGFYSKGNFLHCYERVGSVVEHGYRYPWNRLTYGCFALPGVQ